MLTLGRRVRLESGIDSLDASGKRAAKWVEMEGGAEAPVDDLRVAFSSSSSI